MDNSIIYISWSLPSPNFLKLNIDGSSLGNSGKAGFRGVIRNTTSERVIGFYGSCGVTTSLRAELFALVHGVKLAWPLGAHHIICETDSKKSL